MSTCRVFAIQSLSFHSDSFQGEATCRIFIIELLSLHSDRFSERIVKSF
jgi:hypothetical protein